MPLPHEISSGFHLYKDGDAWCAVGPTFVDLQQSVAGFGDTMIDAVNDLWRQLKTEPSWRDQEPPNFHQFKVWDELI
jgi:hypothetical protein